MSLPLTVIIANLMSHKALAELTLDGLKRRAPEPLQTQSVTAVILALGSNYQAEKHLPRIREKLAALGEIHLSTAFQNPDFTATLDQPKPDYTNQCVYLVLTAPLTLQQLQQRFKRFERDCHRERLTELQTPIKQVTMDIDILVIKLTNNKNSLSKDKSSEWIIMADRYPFKAHESTGVEELVESKSTQQ